MLEESHWHSTQPEMRKMKLDRDLNAYEELIKKVPGELLNAKQKYRLSVLARIKYLLMCIGEFPEKTDLAYELLETVNREYLAEVPIPKAMLQGMESEFAYELKTALLYRNTFKKRIIVCAAKSKTARELLPLLKGTEYEPTMLWDIGATEHDTGILKPDWQSLDSSDTLIIMATKPQITAQIIAELQGVSIGRIICARFLNQLPCRNKFPQLYALKIGGNE
jgi:hypothetical protein